MRVLLLYNPAAGPDRAHREHLLQEICLQLAFAGHQASSLATTAPGSATAQARQAIADGIDCIFACGGDGTVHEVLQGMVDESRPTAPPPILCILPMGSANALSRHLRLSLSPAKAVQQQLAVPPTSVTVGRVDFHSTHRYFTVMAGAGPNATLVRHMPAWLKQSLGRSAYYAHAGQTFLLRRFPPFTLDYTEAATGARHTLRAASALALRIDDLGGLFSRLTRGGHVTHAHLQLVVARPPAWLSLPAWFVMGWAGASRWNPLLRVLDVSEFTCTPLGRRPVHIQADGEWLGDAPMRVSLVPNAVRLLIPTLPKA